MTNELFQNLYLETQAPSPQLHAECISFKTPLCLDDVRKIMADYIEHHNTVRLHSAIAISFLLINSPAEREGYSNQRIQNGGGQTAQNGKKAAGIRSSGEHCSLLTHAA
jgi:hypothetical protein